MALQTTHAILDDDAVTILVLDRHEPTRLGLALLLQRLPWVERCLIAGDEERARLLIRKHRPAAALVDTAQVGPFAGALVASLKEEGPGLQVVLTSHAPGAAVPAPGLLGAAGFVPAGAPTSAVVAALRAALTQEAPVPVPIAPRSTSVLSNRERDVLALLATGATNREIAAQLYLGPDTVKKHASSLYRKLGVRNRTEATQQAATLLAVG